DLVADRDGQLAALAADPNAPMREVSIPDPDVRWTEVTVKVRALSGDTAYPDGYRLLYTALRMFPDDASQPLNLTFDLIDVAQVALLPAPADDGSLPLPTARE